MTDTLPRLGVVRLSVGDPPVFRNPCGRGVLVDFGAILPEVFGTFAAAVAEIAARKSQSPATRLPNVCGGTASGCSSLPPEEHPDAIKAFRGCEGAGAAIAVGVVVPARPDHIENGTAA
jgi:hypothetical protein